MTERGFVEGMAGRWLAAARDTLDSIEQTQMAALRATSEMCAEAIAAGGMAHLFGTGHSRIPLEEMFPRYGSYPGFHPMAELSMTFHTQVAGSNGQRQAMYIERVEGLAEVILQNFEFQPSDMMIVFSSSGTTAVPIEMAIGARQRGMKVVAVTAVEHSKAGRPFQGTGTRLMDHADVVIDICIPVGDAAVSLPGLDTPVGPVSTVANAAVVNEIKVQTAELLLERGKLPSVITSSSVIGADRSAYLFEDAYKDHARRLARTLGGSE